MTTDNEKDLPIEEKDLPIEEKDLSIELIHDILMSDCIGGDINSNMSIFGHNYVIIHCWDGRRFKISSKVLPPGCAFDTETGKPIIGDKK